MLHAVLNKSCQQHPTKNSCMATYFPSYKSSKDEEQDMLDTGGEVRTNSEVMFSYGQLC